MDDLGQVLRDLNGKAITHRVYYRNNDDGRAYDQIEARANAATEGPWEWHVKGTKGASVEWPCPTVRAIEEA